jgi:hypothetical protein
MLLTPASHKLIMQNSAHTSLNASELSAEFSDFEESARYALLQRLTPAIQHYLMGKFQLMGVLATMLERRLQSAEPDLLGMRTDCAAMKSASLTSASSSSYLMTWIVPDKAATLTVDTGVMECLDLLSTEFRFKGFVIHYEASGIDVALSSMALRSVLSAALIALCDLSAAPAELMIRAQARPQRVELSIALRPTEGRATHARSAKYRPLSWRDVQILALAESVKLTRSEGGAQLSFAHAGANEPIENGIGDVNRVEKT